MTDGRLTNPAFVAAKYRLGARVSHVFDRKFCGTVVEHHIDGTPWPAVMIRVKWDHGRAMWMLPNMLVVLEDGGDHND